MKKQPLFFLINVLGLAIGMACSILILMWVRDELSFDRFNENYNNIYRITSKIELETTTLIGTYDTLAGDMLVERMPEVLESVSCKYWGDQTIYYIEQNMGSFSVLNTESDFFSIFSYPFIVGDIESSFSDPASAIITEKMAKQLFGNENPIGKTISTYNYDLTITGIIEDFPSNSHLQFDCIVPLSMEKEFDKNLEKRGFRAYVTYLLFENKVTPISIKEKLDDLLKETDYGSVFFQPLNDVYLNPSYAHGIGLTGERKQVQLFSLLALFILIIACINFTNLSTAASIKRAQEIGMRKVLGAERKQLISQFLTESLFISFLAMVIGLILVLAVLPAFNDISGKSFSWRYLDIIFCAGVFIISILTGLISGIYPAFFLSSLLPVKILKKGFRSNKIQIYFKNILVIFQFTLSLILIISSLVINKQLKYLRNRNPGFNKEHVIQLGWGIPEELKEELIKLPQIENVSKASYSPTNIFALYRLEWTTKDSIRNRQMWGTAVDSDYLDLFGIDIVQGRNFRKGSKNDELTGLIINETAVSQMELEEPIGKEITFMSSDGTKTLKIVGVINDHNFRSYYYDIEPMIIYNAPAKLYTTFIKIKPGNISGTISIIIKTIQKFYETDEEVGYSFLDDEFNETYKMEIKKNEIFNYFTVLAILISCLGLFGLASFMVEQRIKEIGIRKVHGSSVNQIVILLSKDFVKWVIYANIFAIPVSIYFLKNWLQNFAFRISLDIWIFIFAAALTFLIAILSILTLAIKAASANPINSLSYE